MPSTVISQETVIAAPAEFVWAAVTEPAQISQWFTDTAELDLRLGGRGVFAWQEHGTVQLRVETIERPSRFAFRWCHPESAEPTTSNSVRVEFTLTAEGESTRLRVVESGLTEVGWPEAQKRDFTADHTAGWARHLADLAAYAGRRSETPVHS